VAELYRAGWRGVAVELDGSMCARLRTSLSAGLASGRIRVHCPQAANPRNIAALLSAADTPQDLDYLKVWPVERLSRGVRLSLLFSSS
jgi:hypothetical protein